MNIQRNRQILEIYRKKISKLMRLIVLEHMQ